MGRSALLGLAFLGIPAAASSQVAVNGPHPKSEIVKNQGRLEGDLLIKQWHFNAGLVAQFDDISESILFLVGLVHEFR
jgi:hypothetical protein